MLQISKYVFYDITKGKIILAYTCFLLLVSLSLFNMEDEGGKAILSLLNIILIVVPLISMVFSTIHYYNSYEFIELLLSQPVSRTKIILAEFFGTSLSLVGAFLVGVGIPVLFYTTGDTGLTLVVTGCLLTLIFSSLAFLASVKSKDKSRGIGIVLLMWFYFALIYDGLVLLLLFAFSDYPLEKLTLFLSSMNPIDLGRIAVMLKMDVSALMGYTGATYKSFFGSALGTFYTSAVMILWIVLPLAYSVWTFRKKDM